MNPQPKPPKIARRLKQTVIGTSAIRLKVEMRINRGDSYPNIAEFCNQNLVKVTVKMVAHYARNVMGYRRPKITPRSDIERAAIFRMINERGIPDSAMTRGFKAAYNALNERME